MDLSKAPESLRKDWSFITHRVQSAQAGNAPTQAGSFQIMERDVATVLNGFFTFKGDISHFAQIISTQMGKQFSEKDISRIIESADSHFSIDRIKPYRDFMAGQFGNALTESGMKTRLSEASNFYRVKETRKSGEQSQASASGETQRTPAQVARTTVTGQSGIGQGPVGYGVASSMLGATPSMQGGAGKVADDAAIIAKGNNFLRTMAAKLDREGLEAEEWREVHSQKEQVARAAYGDSIAQEQRKYQDSEQRLSDDLKAIAESKFFDYVTNPKGFDIIKNDKAQEERARIMTRALSIAALYDEIGLNDSSNDGKQKWALNNHGAMVADLAGKIKRGEISNQDAVKIASEYERNNPGTLSLKGNMHGKYGYTNGLQELVIDQIGKQLSDKNPETMKKYAEAYFGGDISKVNRLVELTTLKRNTDILENGPGPDLERAMPKEPGVRNWDQIIELENIVAGMSGQSLQRFQGNEVVAQADMIARVTTESSLIKEVRGMHGRISELNQKKNMGAISQDELKELEALHIRDRELHQQGLVVEREQKLTVKQVSDWVHDPSTPKEQLQQIHGEIEQEATQRKATAQRREMSETDFIARNLVDRKDDKRA